MAFSRLTSSHFRDAADGEDCGGLSDVSNASRKGAMLERGPLVFKNARCRYGLRKAFLAQKKLDDAAKLAKQEEAAEARDIERQKKEVDRADRHAQGDFSSDSEDDSGFDNLSSRNGDGSDKEEEGDDEEEEDTNMGSPPRGRIANGTQGAVDSCDVLTNAKDEAAPTETASLVRASPAVQTLKAQKDAVLSQFKRLDTTGSNVIEKAEFWEVLRVLGWDDGELQQLLSAAGAVGSGDRDGKIHYGEFLDWVFSVNDGGGNP